MEQHHTEVVCPLGDVLAAPPLFDVGGELFSLLSVWLAAGLALPPSTAQAPAGAVCVSPGGLAGLRALHSHQRHP